MEKCPVTFFGVLQDGKKKRGSPWRVESSLFFNLTIPQILSFSWKKSFALPLITQKFIFRNISKDKLRKKKMLFCRKWRNQLKVRAVRSANRERVILVSSQAKWRKNSFFIDKSAFSNSGLYVVARLGQFQQLLKRLVILILNFTPPHAITYTNSIKFPLRVQIDVPWLAKQRHPPYRLIW